MRLTNILIRLPADLHREFKAHCDRRHMFMSQVIRQWIADAIERDRRDKK